MIKTPIGADLVRQILQGDRDQWHLWEAFTFSETPQGFGYWDRFARGGVPLTRPAFDNLERMLKIWRAKSDPFVEPILGKMGASIVRAVLARNGEVGDLAGAFVWKRSRQGHAFWRSIANGRRPLTKYGRRALRDMLAVYDAASSAKREVA